MLSTREIMEKYDLTKNSVDNLIRRRKKNWGLKKSSDGSWMWCAQAVEKLEVHLKGRQAIPAVPAKCPPAGQAGDSQDETILLLARAVGDKLNGFQGEVLVKIAAAMDKIQKTQKEEIEILKQENRELASQLKNQMASLYTSLKSQLDVTVEKTVREAKESMEEIVKRTERRKEVKNWGEWFEKILMKPLFVERRHS